MKRLIVEIPDGTLCMFLNYVFVGEGGMKMGVHSVETDELNAGHVTLKSEKEEAE